MNAIRHLTRRLSSMTRVRAGVSPLALAAMLIALVPQCLFGCGMNAGMAPPAPGLAAPMDCCGSACPMEADATACDSGRGEIAPATVAQQADPVAPQAVAAVSPPPGQAVASLAIPFTPQAPRFPSFLSDVPLHLLHARFLI